jgi:hypothetical protein
MPVKYRQEPDMAMKKIEIPQDIYPIKVTLLDTRPPIWRRLLVPSSLTLAQLHAQLHAVLQIAMGWENGHRHEFRAGQRYFGKPDPEDRSMGIDPVENERTVRLSDVLRRAGAKVIYTYDLGDSWEHAIVLPRQSEKQLPAEFEYEVSGLYGWSACMSAGRLWRHPRILRSPGGHHRPQTPTARGTERLARR